MERVALQMQVRNHSTGTCDKDKSFDLEMRHLLLSGQCHHLACQDETRSKCECRIPPLAM